MPKFDVYLVRDRTQSLYMSIEADGEEEAEEKAADLLRENPTSFEHEFEFDDDNHMAGSYDYAHAVEEG